MARLRSEIWVAAYIRRCEVAGAFAALRKRGAAEAGAIFLKIDRLDGTALLLGPAPSLQWEETGERSFALLHSAPQVTPADAEARMARERRFDPDLWLVEVEDRQGRTFLD